MERRWTFPEHSIRGRSHIPPNITVNVTESESISPGSTIIVDPATDERTKELASSTEVLQADGTSSNSLVSRSSQIQAQNSPEENPSIALKQRSKFQDPIWLHWIVLLSFGFMFALLLTALILLYHFSKANQGISVQVSKNHYLWTYGPTALLTIILGLWNRMDYCCKTLTPWARLNSQSQLEQSIFLDYLSPIIPVAVLTAIRNQDWAVVSSTFGGLVLKIIIIFSTSLLVLQPTILTRDGVQIPMATVFNATNLTDTIISNQGWLGLASFIYQGLLKGDVLYPFGTSAVAAYNTPILDGYPAQTTLNLIVDGFYPDFQCTNTEVYHYFGLEHVGEGDFEDDTIDEIALFFNFTSHNCDFSLIRFKLCQPHIEKCPETFVSATVEWEMDQPAPCDRVWILAVAEIHYEYVPGAANSSIFPQTSITLNDWQATIGKVSVVGCMPVYSIEASRIIVDISHATDDTGVSVQQLTNHSDHMLPGFTNDLLVTLFGNEIGSNPLQTDGNLMGDNPDLFPQLVSMMILQAGNVGLSTLLDGEVMATTANEVFKAVMIQMAHVQVSSQTANQVTGSYTYMQDRLHVSLLSVWLIGTGFIILFILSMVVLAFRPRQCVSCSPNSIGGQAAILRSHKTLASMLSHAGHLSDDELRKIGSQKSSTNEPVRELRETRPSEVPKDIRTWWRPLAIQMPFIVMATALPLLLIIVLGVLLHISEIYAGVADVRINISLGQAIAGYSSGFVAFITSLLYHSIDFTQTILGPYYSLKKGNAKADRNIMSNLSGQLPWMITIKSISQGHYAVTLTSIAAILGSFLSIIVSGLFSIQPTTTAHPMVVQLTDTFSSRWYTGDETYSTLIGERIAFIDHEIASYPVGTYAELALPTLTLENSTDIENGSNVFQGLIPVRRSDLNCTFIPAEKVSYDWHGNHTKDASTIQYHANIELPSGCLFANHSAGHYGNVTMPQDAIYANLPIGLLWPTNTTRFEIARILSLKLNRDSNPKSCPTFLAYAAVATFQDSHPAFEQTSMICTQSIHDVHALTTLHLPNFTIEASQPPIVDESTIENRNFLQYNAPIDDHPEDNDGFGPQQSIFDFALPYNGVMDGFFTGLMKRDGISLDQLVGPANQDAFLAAVLHEYRRTMAQIANIAMRKQLFGTEGPYYTGKLLEETRMRVIQDKVSTIILQVFLGLMATCAILVFTFANVRSILPHNPCSIAGALSLLVGSEFCQREDILPKDAEYMSDQELTNALKSQLFSLGWWHAGEDHTNQRRFSIDIGKADDIDTQTIRWRGNWRKFKAIDGVKSTTGLIS